MADSQSSAPLRARADAPASGVIHVRTRHTANFTVLSNRLAQRAGSAVTVGVAAYILSLPDGASIRIDALCAHFKEGRARISAALNELETEGWLERRVERGPGGRIVTRTFVYDAPGATERDVPCPAEAPAVQDVAGPEPEPGPKAGAAPDPRAAAVLGSLRHRDRRLVLSERETAALAPAVAEWLDRGVGPYEIAEALTSGLPDRIDRRPARLLAYRLAALRPPEPAATIPTPARPHPFQDCDGCDRPFRAPRPGRCRDCRDSAPAPAPLAA
ncbi:conserved hypothetical protein [Streptomyces himastatinicus ATCC 53653]|uniref:Uncharacterized protein n=1 Tax=Streptomyces himastatinicus ATCC 53653 TaxID=457427 RepID=D9WCV0_9ACTN|nr:hypothetical protein [Streptomyces himastatinicus]EFL23029.1 conserved hypothetical protein [Streptomyces himastatinicus ATCC 53653]